MAAFERAVGGIFFAGNDRSGLCVFRLRSRRLDGYLSGEQREVRFSYAESAAAQRAVPEQSRRNIHGRDGKGWRRGRRLRNGRGCGGLRRRWLAGFVRVTVRTKYFVSQQR